MGEIEVASKKGTLLEIFICGTGAIVIPVKVIIMTSMLCLLIQQSFLCLRHIFHDAESTYHLMY